MVWFDRIAHLYLQLRVLQCLYHITELQLPNIFNNPILILVTMGPSSINVQDLAKQMVNPEGDLERLIIQYPAESPGKVSKLTLEKILIPRQCKRGDHLYTLTPPENAEKEIHLYSGEGLMRKLHGTYMSSERLKIYQSMKIPEVDEELVTGFGKLVETCHSEKGFYKKDAIDFIRSTLSFLAARAADVQYESWNLEDDLESFPLATKLLTFSENFPPQFPSTLPYPSLSPIKFDGREIRESEARMIMYKFTLARLLIFVHARDSSPANDIRIWQLAGLLLALGGGKVFTQFAMKSERLVLKVSLPQGGGGGGGGPPGGDKGGDDDGPPGGGGGGGGGPPGGGGGGGGGPPGGGGGGPAGGGGGGGGGPPGGGGGPPGGGGGPPGGGGGPPGGGGGPPGGGGGGGGGPHGGAPGGFPWGRVAAFAGLLTVAVAPVLVLGPLAAVLGFGPLGPVAGGIAAGWQASVGVVEAGGLFAMLQGIGMAGAATAAGAPLLATVGAVAGFGAAAVGGSIIANLNGDDGFMVLMQLFPLD
ncbi:hypothetical protein BDZ91DRAFT_851357 [Kalaharituber pfeilii]|nr:hypothetical protein BDZ91DRAFT_851357 [Kalaharituber pfeilii]